MVVPLHDTILVRTFSEKTKNGDGKVVASLEKFTLPLWIRAALASVVRTFLFSLCQHTLGQSPVTKRATTKSNLESGLENENSWGMKQLSGKPAEISKSLSCVFASQVTLRMGIFSPLLSQ